MRLGVIYPQTEFDGDPQALTDFGKAAEAIGFDHLGMFEHVAGAVHEGREPRLTGPYSEKHAFHDPLVAFGYLAGITDRIELVTSILVLPQRQTLLAARQAADVDLFSNGRLRLGIGVGWNHAEYAALGEDYSKRGARMSEQIVLLRKLWRESPVSFAGTFDSIDRMGLNPQPNRVIPLWCGGSSAAAYDRAVKLADGFIFGSVPADVVLPAWRQMKENLDAEGRGSDIFGAEYNVPNGPTLAETVARVRRWEDAGGTSVSVLTLGQGFTEMRQHLDYIADLHHRLTA